MHPKKPVTKPHTLETQRLQGMRIGVVCACCAALMFSFSGLMIKLIQAPALLIAGLRALVAALCLAGSLRRERPRLEWRLWLFLLAFTSTVWLFVRATQCTTAANATWLQGASPAWLWMLVWVSSRGKERRFFAPVLVILAGLMAAFLVGQPTGVALVGAARGGGCTSALVGDVMGLVAGMTLALMLLLLKHLSDCGIQVLCLANAFAAWLLLGAFWGQFGTQAWSIITQLTLQDWGVLAFLGVMQQGLPYWLFAAAARRLAPGQLSMLLLLEPITNPIWVWLLLGETPSQASGMGGAAILLGLLLDTHLRRLALVTKRT